MLVERHHQRLQAERDVAFQQQVDPPPAALVRAGDAGNPLIGFLGGAVKGDLHLEWSPFRQVVGNLRGDQGAVGENRQDQAFAFGIRVNIEEILAQKRLAAGQQQPEAACIGDLIQDALDFCQAELGLALRRRGSRLVYNSAGSAGCSAWSPRASQRLGCAGRLRACEANR